MFSNAYAMIWDLFVFNGYYLYIFLLGLLTRVGKKKKNTLNTFQGPKISP